MVEEMCLSKALLCETKDRFLSYFLFVNKVTIAEVMSGNNFGFRESFTSIINDMDFVIKECGIHAVDHTGVIINTILS